MKNINRLLIAGSNRWWVVLLAGILTFSSFNVLFGFNDQFKALTGSPVFDTQNDLIPEAILKQVPLYTGEARNIYFRFAAFDLLVILFVCIFAALLWALLLRLNTWPLPQKLLAVGFALFPLFGIVLDFAENFSFVSILNAGAAPGGTLIGITLLFNRLKLLWLVADSVVVAGLLILLVVHVASRLIRRPQSAT